MLLRQEDINIYLEDIDAKKFYNEYNKNKIDILKLLKLSKDNHIHLFEPLKLDHFLLVDISLYFRQIFEITNINQFNRYMDLLNYFFKLYDYFNDKSEFKIMYS